MSRNHHAENNEPAQHEEEPQLRQPAIPELIPVRIVPPILFNEQPLPVNPDLTLAPSDIDCLSPTQLYPTPYAHSQEGADLHNLPPEIIHKIFNYIDPLFLHRVVSVVCRKFNSILQWEPMWRKSFHIRNSLGHVNHAYLKYLDMYSTRWKSGIDTSWRELCVALESAKVNWFAKSTKVTFPVCEHIVDVVHVMEDNNFCLTGSRERTLILWDIKQCASKYEVGQAHNGWVSGIDSTQQIIMTSGWDSYVKLWAAAESRVVPLGKACLQLAVMDVVGRRGMIAACTFPDLFLIDPRICRPDSYYNFPMEGGCLNHLKFWKDNNVILSSRRKKLIHFDLRMQRVVKCIDIPMDTAPRTLSVQDDLAFIGDNSGNIYLFDISTGFNLVETYNISKNSTQVRMVIPRRGHMIAGTSDGKLQVVSLMKDADEVRILASDHLQMEISSGHYSKGVMVVIMTTVASSGAATIYTIPKFE